MLRRGDLDSRRAEILSACYHDDIVCGRFIGRPEGYERGGFPTIDNAGTRTDTKGRKDRKES